MDLKLKEVTLFVATFIVLGILTYTFFDRPSASIVPFNDSFDPDFLETLQLRESFLKNFDISDVSTIYVIPGGGGGSDGYPEWTKVRVEEALTMYQMNNEKDNAIFVALSGGSLNSKNSVQDDGRIIFECQHVIRDLQNHGISPNRIFGDFSSWDSVTNGLVLRQLMEGLHAIHRNSEKKYKRKIDVHIFISDFHRERIELIFNWILGLTPSVMDKLPIDLLIHSIKSKMNWFKNQDDFNNRIAHERASVRLLEEKKLVIRTIDEFHAYLFLGGHKGLKMYLDNQYKVSSGGGW